MIDMPQQVPSVGPVGTERILGHRVDPVSRVAAADAVVERALGGGPGAYVCLTNVHTTVESQRSSALRRAVDDSFLSVPDGMPLTWILRRRGHPATEKVTGAPGRTVWLAGCCRITGRHGRIAR